MQSATALVREPRPDHLDSVYDVDGVDELEPAHGYPPPRQPVGCVVIAYCGAPMVVRGESAFSPPPDTCPACVSVWHRLRGNRG